MQLKKLSGKFKSINLNSGVSSLSLSSSLSTSSSYALFRWFIYYIFCIVIISFLNAFTNRIHGEFCGLQLFSPKTWFYTMALSGSPVCKSLNYFSHVFNKTNDIIFMKLY